MLPLQCGLLEGTEHRQTPMALSFFLSSFSRHCPSQFEKAAAAVRFLTWGVFKQPVLVWSDKQKLPFTPCRKGSAAVGYWCTCKHYRQSLAGGREVAGSQLTQKSNISLYSGGTL